MLLIGNGRLLTRDSALPYVEKGCVAIQDELIVATGTTADMKKRYPQAEFLDAGGKVIMPGVINTHMHLYSTFARGMGLKDQPPGNFVEILQRLWWRLDKALTLEDVYYSAMPVLIDCIKCGTTTIFDHHASPHAVRDSLFTLERAARDAGIRASLCYEISDRDGQTICEEGIRENAEFAKYANSTGEGMVRGMFGLHASMTLSDESLKACVKANEGVDAGFHVHTAEGYSDQEFTLKTYGKTPVQRFADFGMYGAKSIAVHCVHITPEDRAILKKTGTNVVHNPESNMGNAVGCAPVLQMYREGIRVGLGTDGYTSDMFESLKVANILHKHHLQHPSAVGGEVQAMLFANNPAIAAEFFPKPLGILKEGAYADVIVADYIPPTAFSEANADWHLLFGVSGRAVDTTVIHGKVLMKGGQLTTLDEQAICAKARELSKDVWERF